MRWNTRQLEGLHQIDEQAIRMIESFLAITPLYRGAMREVSTKLEVLDEEFQILHDHNPIHHIERRMKTPESIVEKMGRKGVPFTIEALREQILDVAGLRVVCNHIGDIYRLGEMLTAQDDIELVRYSDYIEKPKPSGYRSLHIVVKVPVFLIDRCEKAPVEVQLRSLAMDMWASLEHELRYKSGRWVEDAEARELRRCADDLFDIDRRMHALFEHEDATFAVP